MRVNQKDDPAFTVRRLEMRDFPELHLLFEEVDRLHREALPRYFRKSEIPARTPETFSTWLEDPNTALFGAERTKIDWGDLYSFRAVAATPLHVPRGFGLIDVLVVAPEARNSGVGAALMKEAQTWAKNKGATQMEINVWEFNSLAMSFYEKQGYRTQSRKLSMPL